LRPGASQGQAERRSLREESRRGEEKRRRRRRRGGGEDKRRGEERGPSQPITDDGSGLGTEP